nr:MAG TPA: hypothetical protein [Caudoviricetes sp.]
MQIFGLLYVVRVRKSVIINRFCGKSNLDFRENELDIYDIGRYVLMCVSANIRVQAQSSSVSL